MIDPSSLLRAADPLRDESARDGLSPDDARAIRDAMLRTLAAVPGAVDARPIWRRPLPLAAAAALVASVSGVVGHRLLTTPVTRETTGAAPSPLAPEDAEQRRQLQFATPGGTRIIWVFDDNLRLQEPIP